MLTVANLGMTPEAGDHFGWAVGTATSTWTSCTDLVVGAPGEDLPEVDAGAVHVVYGSKDGINAGTTSEHMTQFDAGGAIEAGDHFGQTVAVGENLGQDTSVVVAGAPGEDIGAAADAGAVNIVNFSDSIPTQPREVTQNTSGIPDAAEAGDQFGASIALGVDMLRDDDSWELLAGAPGESVGSRARPARSPSSRRSRASRRPAPGRRRGTPRTVPGSAAPWRRATASAPAWPSATATSSRPGSLRRIAVGVPGEDVGSHNAAGAVNLFTASGSGLQGLTVPDPEHSWRRELLGGR